MHAACLPFLLRRPVDCRVLAVMRVIRSSGCPPRVSFKQIVLYPSFAIILMTIVLLLNTTRPRDTKVADSRLAKEICFRDVIGCPHLSESPIVGLRTLTRDDSPDDFGISSAGSIEGCCSLVYSLVVGRHQAPSLYYREMLSVLLSFFSFFSSLGHAPTTGL